MREVNGRAGLGRLGLDALDLGEGVGTVGEGLGPRGGGKLEEDFRGRLPVLWPRRVLAQRDRLGL